LVFIRVDFFRDVDGFEGRAGLALLFSYVDLQTRTVWGVGWLDDERIEHLELGFDKLELEFGHLVLVAVRRVVDCQGEVRSIAAFGVFFWADGALVGHSPWGRFQGGQELLLGVLLPLLQLLPLAALL
jgi:hypothetical protein